MQEVRVGSGTTEGSALHGGKGNLARLNVANEGRGSVIRFDDEFTCCPLRNGAMNVTSMCC